MDLTELSLKEVWSLHNMTGFEIAKRLWWLYLLIFIVYIGLEVYTNRGNFKKSSKKKRG